jgi:L-fuculose-phosphate aldolase
VNDSPRHELAKYSAKIVHRGLAVGPGGNTSLRDGDVMWISPSGYGLDDIGDADWVAVGIEDGLPRQAAPRPSSETLMHLALYRVRPDVQAIVHTHPPTVIGVISAGIDDIPFLFPDHVAIVGKLPCIDYVTPCTPELASAVAVAMRDARVNGLLMRNHGLITVGKTVKEAYYRTEVVEDAARVYLIARSIGVPAVLNDEQATEILTLEAERYRQRLLSGALPS